MKIRKLLCILCALSTILALTACDHAISISKDDERSEDEPSGITSTPTEAESNVDEPSDHTSAPKVDENSAGESSVAESFFQLSGKDCYFTGDDARLSLYPEPYCSLYKDKQLKPGIQTTASTGLNKRPYYKAWLTNNQDTDCAYTDAKISKFFMLGGEPGDMVYHGVTFGQTKEEVDKIAEANPKINYGSNQYESTLRSLLFQELGENWADQITEEYYVYNDRAPGGLDYNLYVVFLDGKVYAMAVQAFYGDIF